MPDPFKGHLKGIESPYERAYAVTPDDANDLPTATRGIVSGYSGNIVVDTVGGDTNIAVPVAAGIPVQLRVRRIRATGTTARDTTAGAATSGIVALY